MLSHFKEIVAEKVLNEVVHTTDEPCEDIATSNGQKSEMIVDLDSISQKYRSKSSSSSTIIKKDVHCTLDDDDGTIKDSPLDGNLVELPNVTLQQVKCTLVQKISAVSPNFNHIVQAVIFNDLSCLETFVLKHFGSDSEIKSTFNILYIAAAVGTTECCQYLLDTGFTANTLSLHPLIKQVVSKAEKLTTNLSPLAIAMCYNNLGTFRLLLKHTSNDILETCISMPPDIEAIFMKDLVRRLLEKYRSLKPRVVAGYEEDIPVLVVYSETLRTDTENFCGKKVKFVNPKIVKREHSDDSELDNKQSSQISEENMNVANQIIKERSKSLWNDHSNLNIISVSSTKSVRGKMQLVPVCITLYCTSKGFIPLGEPKFPTIFWTSDGIHKIPVDVREGYFTFCPGYATAGSLSYHEELKMGCSISRETNAINGGGTLGPFVDINGQTGFLTCAHVMFDISKGPFRYENDQCSDIGVVQPAQGTFSFIQQGSESFQSACRTPCGFIKRAVFNPHLPVSIDAALVQITNPVRDPKRGQFAIENKFGYTSLGFNDAPEYNSGRSKLPKELSVFRQVIKCGRKTHLTRGLLTADGIQVRPLETWLGLPSMQTMFPMTNQMEIQGVETHSPFLQAGDSGSAVFTVNEDGSLECIGMAIGFTSNHKAVVTPINAILEALGPGIVLKAFPTLH